MSQWFVAPLWWSRNPCKGNTFPVWWKRRKGNQICFCKVWPEPFPICFKLLRKVNILANLSERFIGSPKCNLLGDWLSFNSFGSSLQKGPHCYHLPGQRLHFLPSITLAGHVSVFRCESGHQPRGSLKLSIWSRGCCNECCYQVCN